MQQIIEVDSKALAGASGNAGAKCVIDSELLFRPLLKIPVGSHLVWCDNESGRLLCQEESGKLFWLSESGIVDKFPMPVEAPASIVIAGKCHNAAKVGNFLIIASDLGLAVFKHISGDWAYLGFPKINPSVSFALAAVSVDGYSTSAEALPEMSVVVEKGESETAAVADAVRNYLAACRQQSLHTAPFYASVALLDAEQKPLLATPPVLLTPSDMPPYPQVISRGEDEEGRPVLKLRLLNRPCRLLLRLDDAFINQWRELGITGLAVYLTPDRQFVGDGSARAASRISVSGVSKSGVSTSQNGGEWVVSSQSTHLITPDSNPYCFGLPLFAGVQDNGLYLSAIFDYQNSSLFSRAGSSPFLFHELPTMVELSEYLKVDDLEFSTNRKFAIRNIKAISGGVVSWNCEVENADGVMEKREYEIFYANSVTPWFFSLNRCSNCFSAKILNICERNKSVSNGQFGQFPALAITRDGVLALKQGDNGEFLTSQRICNLAISESSGKSVAELPQAVAFAASAGLIMLQGNALSDISLNLQELILGEGTGVHSDRYQRWIASAKCWYDTASDIFFIWNSTDNKIFWRRSGEKVWKRNEFPAEIEFVTSAGLVCANGEILQFALREWIQSADNYSQGSEGARHNPQTGEYVTAPIFMNGASLRKVVALGENASNIIIQVEASSQKDVWDVVFQGVGQLDFLRLRRWNFLRFRLSSPAALLITTE